jgi:hypothetical protein
MKKILLVLGLCVVLTSRASTGAGYSPQTLAAPASGKTQLVIYSPTTA